MHTWQLKAISGIAKGKYVLKRYKEDKVDEIKVLFGTTESHTRKVIQMNALARNFAQNLDLERAILEYGATFTYSKVYYSSFNGEFVTLEDFIEGTFEKYINNTGEICGDGTSEISLKAEAFVHFTYVNSNQQLIVSDIQGVNYWLCDVLQCFGIPTPPLSSRPSGFTSVITSYTTFLGTLSP